MRYLFFLICSSLLIAGCTDAMPTVVVQVTATPSPLCDVWQVSDTAVVCTPYTSGYIVQSQTDQITLQAYDLSVVISGTILLLHDNVIEIFVLEGNAVAGVRGQNRILSIGQRVSVPLSDGIAQFPGEISPIMQRPAGIPYSTLPRAIDRTAFVIQPTAAPTATSVIIPTPLPDVCPPPDNWRASYIISPGDTLQAIANRFEVGVDVLAAANCINNIGRISVGRELVVPANDSEATQEPLPQLAIGFRADAYAVNAGECTTLRWDGFGAQAIYLDDEQVSESSSRDICLDETQSFTMRVDFNVERSEIRELTITVQDE